MNQLAVHSRDTSLPTLRRTYVWWIHPAWLAALCGLIGPLLALTTSSDRFERAWHEPKAFTSALFLTSVTLVAALCVGCLFGSLPFRLRSRERDNHRFATDQVSRMRRASTVCFWLVLAGYGAWAAIGLSRGARPADIQAVLRGSAGALHELKVRLRPVAGVTTLTQFGPIFVLLEVMRARTTKEWARRRVAIIVALTVIRTVFYAERLALVEIIVPATFLLASTVSLDGLTMRRKRTLALAPVLVPLAVVFVFGTFEYGRSWTFYRQRTSESYPTFVVDRLKGYYATAANNSALIVREQSKDVSLPYYTTRWFWDFPGMASVADYRSLTGHDATDEYAAILGQQANPEFNNEGGVLPAVADYGEIGAIVWWLLAGLAVGNTFGRFMNGSSVGLLAFPILCTGLLELSRIEYWVLGRTFPMMVGAVVAGRYVDRRIRTTP